MLYATKDAVKVSYIETSTISNIATNPKIFISSARKSLYLPATIFFRSTE